MINEYQVVINSTEDIPRALSAARKSGIVYDYYNTVIYLRGSSGSVIEVDRRLKGLYVVAQGPADVHVLDEASVIAEGKAVVRVYGKSLVTAREQSTVYAYDSALVTLEDYSRAHILSGDVDIVACDDSQVLIPDEYGDEVREWARLRDDATIVHH